MRLLGFMVAGYKGLTREVRLPELGPVNVIHGENDVGKSSVLEAMFLFFRLLSRELVGGEIPLDKPAPIDPGAFSKRTGIELAHVFHLASRQPVRLQGAIEVEPEELARDGIEPLLPTPVDIALKLNPTEEGAELQVERFRFADGSDAVGLTNVAQRQFVRRFALFLARNKLFHDRQERATFALVDEQRRLRGEPPGAGGVGLIPQQLRQQLFEARDSLEASRVRRWELFVETVES